MTTIKSAATLFAVSVIGLAGCGGGTTNVTVNSNTSANRSSTMDTASNTMGSAVNSMGNAASSAANTVSNAASSMTTASVDSFMKDAAHGGMAEVELGKLASTKGANAEVKSFGRMMITDHSKANTELKALAAKKNITLPTDMGPHASTIDKLKTLSGADFDKSYVDAMVSDHQKDVSAFQAQADNATDPEVKAFAAKTLPTLKKHLEMIQSIQSKVNNAGAANTSTGNTNTGMRK